MPLAIDIQQICFVNYFDDKAKIYMYDGSMSFKVLF